MKKQKTIITSISLGLLAVLFLAGCNGKNQDGSAATPTPVKVTTPAVPAGDNNINSTKPSGDADIDAINKDLNSVNDEDFGDNSLSDTQVGL